MSTEPWDEEYKEALRFLSGIYAAEEVRMQQRWANDRGAQLTREEIAKSFKEARDYMSDRIHRTATEK